MKRETVLHYELTIEELRAERNGGYVDPDRYKEGHRDYSPGMLCQTGEFRAPGTRNRSIVNCAACLEALRLGGPGVSPYARRLRAALGDDFENALRFVEPRGVVFIVTQHVTRSHSRVFLPVVFFRRSSEEKPPTDVLPARDSFRMGRRFAEVLGWRWDSRHIGWVEQVGGGQSPTLAVRELSRVLFNDPQALIAVEV